MRLKAAKKEAGGEAAADGKEEEEEEEACCVCLEARAAFSAYQNKTPTKTVARQQRLSE